jgi:hypothetical protein
LSPGEVVLEDADAPAEEADDPTEALPAKAGVIEHASRVKIRVSRIMALSRGGWMRVSEAILAQQHAT